MLNLLSRPSGKTWAVTENRSKMEDVIFLLWCELQGLVSYTIMKEYTDRSMRNLGFRDIKSTWLMAKKKKETEINTKKNGEITMPMVFICSSGSSWSEAGWFALDRRSNGWWTSWKALTDRISRRSRGRVNEPKSFWEKKTSVFSLGSKNCSSSPCLWWASVCWWLCPFQPGRNGLFSTSCMLLLLPSYTYHP